MILSFACKATRKLFLDGDCDPRWRSIESVAFRKLDMLDAATTVSDLRVPPGNRLEVLKGNRQGQWSIRINDQWRVCFRWDADGPSDVAIVDYH
jgi:proteic killer suppression protein